MNYYELQQEVTIQGENIWGRPSVIIFRPHVEDAATSKNWQWAPTLDSPSTPISPEIARYQNRNIQLFHGKNVLNCWEHLGALRYLIPSNVTVIGSGWPPHFCGFRKYRDALLKASKETRVPPALYTVAKQLAVDEYSSRPVRRYTSFAPTSSDTPQFTIDLAYPGIVYPHPNDDDPKKSIVREALYEARILGHSNFNIHRSLATLAQLILKWKHFHTINWTGYDLDLQTSKEAHLDRVSQLLGVMSLLGNDGIFVAKVEWRHSGLRSDLALAAMAAQHTVQHASDLRLFYLMK